MAYALESKYRTRAIRWRSRSVAAPLEIMLKAIFYAFFCDNQRAQKIIFEYKLRHLMARVRYLLQRYIQGMLTQ